MAFLETAASGPYEIEDFALRTRSTRRCTATRAVIVSRYRQRAEPRRARPLARAARDRRLGAPPGPRGICPALKSPLRSVPFFTFCVVTALALICSVPTLFGASATVAAHAGARQGDTEGHAGDDHGGRGTADPFRSHWIPPCGSRSRSYRATRDNGYPSIVAGRPAHATRACPVEALREVSPALRRVAGASALRRAGRRLPRCRGRA